MLLEILAPSLLAELTQKYGLDAMAADSPSPPDCIDSTDARAAPFLLLSPWGGALESVFSQVSWLILLCTQVENLWPEAWEAFRKCLQNELP